MVHRRTVGLVRHAPTTGGPRDYRDIASRLIGAAFANTEMNVVLCTLLRDFILIQLAYEVLGDPAVRGSGDGQES
jgi:hypothetical protein